MGIAKVHLAVDHSDENDGPSKTVYNSHKEVREVNVPALEKKIREVVDKFAVEPDSDEEAE
jgi:hypothetical protein